MESLSFCDNKKLYYKKHADSGYTLDIRLSRRADKLASRYLHESRRSTCRGKKVYYLQKFTPPGLWSFQSYAEAIGIMLKQYSSKIGGTLGMGVQLDIRAKTLSLFVCIKFRCLLLYL